MGRLPVRRRGRSRAAPVRAPPPFRGEVGRGGHPPRPPFLGGEERVRGGGREGGAGRLPVRRRGRSRAAPVCAPPPFRGEVGRGGGHPPRPPFLGGEERVRGGGREGGAGRLPVRRRGRSRAAPVCAPPPFRGEVGRGVIPPAPLPGGRRKSPGGRREGGAGRLPVRRRGRSCAAPVCAPPPLQGGGREGGSPFLGGEERVRGREERRWGGAPPGSAAGPFTRRPGPRSSPFRGRSGGGSSPPAPLPGGRRKSPGGGEKVGWGASRFGGGAVHAPPRSALLPPSGGGREGGHPAGARGGGRRGHPPRPPFQGGRRESPRGEKKESRGEERRSRGVR